MVQQHVALGDMIIRDLPDIDVIQAGVRHHHERWDGEGYLDHLAGEAYRSSRGCSQSATRSLP